MYGSGRGLIQGNILELTWETEENGMKNSVRSVCTAGVGTGASRIQKTYIAC
jgi:hypothetical protein